MKIQLTLCILVFTLLSATAAFAIETAPRISDREIIEGLADLRATQKVILQQFEDIDRRFEDMGKGIEDRFDGVNKRFELVDKRFEQIDKRFEQIDKRFEQVDKRFEQVDKRFEQVDKRLDDMSATNRMFFGFVMSTLLALFGYIVWDRRTLMKPLEERIFTIERELDIGSTEGTKVGRLMKMLRELSKEDDKVAKVLKDFHLL